MKFPKQLLLVLLASVTGLTLGGCSEVTQYFADNPAEVSSCANLIDEFGEGFACVECNSDSNEKVEFQMCGMSLTARCNSADGYPPVYGIAFGFLEYIEPDFVGYKGSTAWLDTDEIPGPSGGDSFVCHDQSGGYGGFKNEYKCSSSLQGNGKQNGVTFETELKYDPAKDDC